MATGALVAAEAADDCSPSDSWCELGAAISGLLVGGLIGLVVYVATGLGIVRRCRPAGSRAGHIAAHIVSPVLLLVLAGLIAELTAM